VTLKINGSKEDTERKTLKLDKGGFESRKDFLKSALEVLRIKPKYMSTTKVYTVTGLELFDDDIQML